MKNVTSEISSHPYNKINVSKGELKQPITLQSSQPNDPPPRTLKHIIAHYTGSPLL
jgi:hypothetical protein